LKRLISGILSAHQLDILEPPRAIEFACAGTGARKEKGERREKREATHRPKLVGGVWIDKLSLAERPANQNVWPQNSHRVSAEQIRSEARLHDMCERDIVT
jgi:hypothetical protein